jgi:methyltransferase-like protein
LASASKDDQTPYAQYLQQELELVKSAGDYYLYHDHMEENNRPAYFHEMVEKADKAGLRFLGEADLRVMVPGNFSDEVRKTLQQASPDNLHLEQYMDFLRNRTFRQTLFVRKGRAPDYAIGVGRLEGMYLATPAEVPEPLDLSPNVSQAFRAGPATVNSSEPLTKAALAELGRAWPARVRFEDLVDRAAALSQTQAPADALREALGQRVLEFYTKGGDGLIEIAADPLPATAEPGETPSAPELARHQAAAGRPVTSLRHESIGLTEFDRRLLMRLDGKTDLATLSEQLAADAEAGVLTVRRDETPITDPSELRAIIANAVRQQLAALARRSLLAAG